MLIFIIIIDTIILLMFDSIHCDKDIFAIMFGVSLQVFCYLLLKKAEILDDIRFLDKLRSPMKIVILIIGSFAFIINGSMGMDKAGRTTQCPNTGLSYLYFE